MAILPPPLGLQFVKNAFNPSNIAGLQLWLDATTGLFDATSGGNPVTTDGGSVARWEDQSGSGYHVTQATLANRPVLKTGIRNSKNAIRFDGSNDALVSANIADNNLSAMTCFVVSYIAGFGGNSVGRYFERSGVVNGRLWFVDGRDLGAGPQSLNAVLLGSAGTGHETALNSISSANWFLSSVRWDGGTSYLTNVSQRINRSASTKGNSSTFFNESVANTAYVIGNRAALNRAFNGDIAELIIYNQALTTEQIDNVEGYLAAKWGF
jgi:hypothetical protein